MMLPQEITVSRTSAPAVPNALRLRARERIAHYVQRANTELNARLPMPTCSFDLRGKVAGKALGKQNHLQLNAVLFMENVDAFLADTIPHEVAHLITGKLYSQQATPHGKEWQEVMRKMGLSPTRCHSFDTANAAVASTLYRYRCRCKAFEFSLVRHQRAQRRPYACRVCKQALGFTGQVRLQGVWLSVPLLAGADPAAALSAQATPARTTAAPPLAPASMPVARPVPPSAEPPRGGPASLPKPRAPTPAMCQYVKSLARKLGWDVPAVVLERYDAASAFISRANKAVAEATAAVRAFPAVRESGAPLVEPEPGPLAPALAEVAQVAPPPPAPPNPLALLGVDGLFPVESPGTGALHLNEPAPASAVLPVAMLPATPPVVFVEPTAGVVVPSDKQLAYAQSLANRHGLVIPVAVKRNRKLLSAWIKRCSA